MKKSQISLFSVILSLAFAQAAWPGTTVVGNGDDGSDLEGAIPIESGKILESRAKAAQLVEHLNAQNIPGLGLLLSEVKSATLYRVKGDQASSLPEDQGAFHANMRGQVYARTIARPHAATRFFPIAEKLDDEQLVALQIHEALHRSLPESVRENESVVSKVTMAITSPDANYDQVKSAVDTALPAADRRGPSELAALSAGAGASGAQSVAAEVDAYPIPDDARIRMPSLLAYTYRHYQSPQLQGAYPVSSMHVLQSYMYPFGSDRVPLGLGMEAAFISLPNESQMGPLGLSARMRLWSGRGFDVSAWASASLNMLSAEELKNSQLGRDVYTFGLTATKDLEWSYFESSFGVSARGSSQQTIGSVEYTHSYGDIINVATHAGGKLGKVRAGGFAEINLATYHRVQGGAFLYDSGRFRIISVGPELGWYTRSFSVSGKGRLILDTTRNANFDDLGNLMGSGVAQGSFEATVAYYF